MTDPAGPTGQNVVVGIDGSECSTAALEWAASYAAAIGTKVHAVAVWKHPSSMEFDMEGGPWDREGSCRKKAEKQVASVAAHHPGLEIDLEVAQGAAAHVLIDASQKAALLVVGTRGHSGLANLMLGSTSTRCVHDATCPVVVYR